jgi:hypothetical protein
MLCPSRAHSRTARSHRSRRQTSHPPLRHACEGRHRTSAVTSCSETCALSKSFRPPSEAELLSLCVAKEKGNQRERPPRLALVGHPAQQVREPWPGFSTGHPALAKRSRHPCRLPLRGLSTPPHRRTGAPVEQRAILARTRCATAAQLRERAQRQRERPLSARSGRSTSGMKGETRHARTRPLDDESGICLSLVLLKVC